MSPDVEALKRAVSAALAAVVRASGGGAGDGSDPVRDLEVEASGDVRFAVQLRGDAPGSLVKELRAAAEGVDGVGKVKVNVQLPKSPSGGSSAAAAGGGGLKPGSVPAPTPRPGSLPTLGT